MRQAHALPSRRFSTTLLMSSQTWKTTSHELGRDADHPQEVWRARSPASLCKSRYTPKGALPTLLGYRTFTSAPETSRTSTPYPSDPICRRAIQFFLPDIHRPGLLPPLLPPRLASQLPLARSRFLDTDHPRVPSFVTIKHAGTWAPAP